MHNKFTIDEPQLTQKDDLRNLWKEAFSDTDTFLDTFDSTAFSSTRCRCITLNGKVVAALYWFDCTFVEKKVAYIYAVATDKKFRGQGLCHSLMTDTHHHLMQQGYAFTLLSPATETLFSFYRSLGYKNATYIKEIDLIKNTLSSPQKDIQLRAVHKQEFAKLRRKFLPTGSVIQEEENLEFLATQAYFFAGEDFLLTAHIDGTHLHGLEFLGETSLLPYIMQALNCTSAYIRTPGKVMPHTMYYPFVDGITVPEYFGFTFD